MFYSIKQDKLITFKEYVNSMAEGQKYIYYGAGNSILQIKKMPQVEKVLNSGFDVLCMTDNVDEFAIKYIGAYMEKEFKNVTDGDTEVEKHEEELDESDKKIVEELKTILAGEVFDVRLSSKLGEHPVCFMAEGEISIEMEKVLRSMPVTDENSQNLKAKKILEINSKHKIYEKIKSLYETDKDSLKEVAFVLVDSAKLADGLPIEDPAKYIERVTNLISK